MKRPVFLLYSLVILINLALITSGWCQDEKKSPGGTPSKVLILPYNINAEKDLTFLKDGISDMLSTRLSIEGVLIPISRIESEELLKNLTGPVTEDKAVSLGKKAKADFAVFGSLTVFGDSISTDSRLIDIKTRTPQVTFFETAQNQGEVISHINLFAEKISEKFLGKPAADTKSEPPAAAPADESRKHPEALWNEESGIYSASPQSGENTTESQQLKTSVWKSRTFNTEIQGVAVGDTNGNGLNETVFIGGQSVYIYRHHQNKFVQIAEIKEKAYHSLLGVDVADINGNGKAEIFVTAVNPNIETNQSYVLEWNGTQYAKIVNRSDWYFRVMKVPGRSHVLVGQKRGMKDFFSGGIHELAWMKNNYDSVRPMGLPLWVNVFGFVTGELDGQEMTVAFAQNDHIRVLTQGGKEEWRSNEPFGGSLLYVESRPAASSKAGQYNETERRYIPLRILMRDMDGDGKTDIVVGKNADMAGKVFEKFRLFKNGNIQCLGWDQIGLFEKWKTRNISGYLSDYAVADVNNDGKDELVVSVISKTDSVISKARSFIIYHELK